MNLFDVYPLYNVTPVKAIGSTVWDKDNQQYLDLYGGHGVISVGHSHPKYVAKLTEQLNAIGFYSNAVQNPLQQQLAKKLGEVSNCEDYNLFLCNSGAEANENALKVASFMTGKSRVISFENSFHGRTSASVSVTDNKKIQAAINTFNPVTILPLNELFLVEKALEKGDVCSVIIEGIQGVGGLDEGTTEFFKGLEKLCWKYEALLILDEIQSGYGRSGAFFAFQHHQIKPDMITVAKGMGNGYPIAGVLIHESIKASYGMLGTTFGGNHLACAAGLAVLEIIEEEDLIANVNDISDYFIAQVKTIDAVKNIKGKGLMIGLEFEDEVGDLRKKILYEEHIFTGGAMNKKLIRILPPLNITTKEIDVFITALKKLV
ncbi:MAG: aspartate aminotransferase family protein [Flavobacteriaceae bacterium]|nr:MAG: aspartate aminotransferase family protein [Flavobacteriaceae bacterium]